MGSVAGQTKRLESAISIGLLSTLFLIGLGVFIKQSNYDMSRFGVDTDVTAILSQQQDVTKQKRINLSSLAPAGFETLSKGQVYEPDNLYEKINGKAPLYLESGFQKLFTQQFVNKDDENLSMELSIYDMARTRNAFSIYSVQRRPEAEILPDMQFGYRAGNAMFFVHGKYYIELVGSSESDELFKVMAEVAQAAAANLAIETGTEINELSLFPTEDLVLGSIKLYLASAFGCERLTDIFAARYQFGDQTITAFLDKRPDPEDAQTLVELYHNFLIENGGVIKPTTNETLKAIKAKVVDFYDTTEIVLAIGPFVAGIHEAENQLAAEKLLVILINKLNEVAKSIKND